MSKEYFKVFHSYLKSIEPLNDAERGRLFTAMLEYSITGVEPKLNGNERFIFPTMKANLDREVESYRNTVEANRLNGRKGGRPQKPKESEKTHSVFEKPKESEKSQDKDKDKDKDNNIPPHTPPSGGEDTQSAFERFWTIYPNRKCGKANALKSWNKFKHTSELDEIILAAVERQKAWPDWQKDGGQYIPMATTWLNQRRWDAEEKGGEQLDYWTK